MDCLKRTLWALAVAAAALAPVSVRGGDADPPAVAWTAYRAPLRFETISIEQGLSQSSVVAILQDRKGFLWFGTDNGLNRLETSESLGLQIVRDLVSQFDGTIRVENQEGTVYSIMFPAPEAREGGGGDR